MIFLLVEAQVFGPFDFLTFVIITWKRVEMVEVSDISTSGVGSVPQSFRESSYRVLYLTPD